MKNPFKSDSSDQRKYKRLKIPLDTKFKIISGENSSDISKESNGIVKNISADGLCLEAGFVQIGRFHISHDSSMTIKNKLGMELQLRSEDESKTIDTIYILGEVIWYDKNDLNSKYPFHIGVQTLEISEDDKKKFDIIAKD
jgi:hypothetical protein